MRDEGLRFKYYLYYLNVFSSKSPISHPSSLISHLSTLISHPQNSPYTLRTYFVKITIICPSILPSICSVLSGTRRIFLTTVPSFAFRVEPFTSRDLVSTTLSPA